MVMITIMVVTAICVGVVAVMLERFMVAEASDVERELINIRTHWAKMGQVHYALSRAMGHYDNSAGANNVGICNDSPEPAGTPPDIETDCTDDNARITVLQNYLDEIQTISSNGNLVRRWDYDEFPNDAYYVSVRVVVVEDDDAVDDGDMRFVTQVPTQTQGEDLGNAPLFENFRPRPIHVDICFSINSIACAANATQGRGIAFITQHRIN